MGLSRSKSVCISKNHRNTYDGLIPTTDEIRPALVTLDAGMHNLNAMSLSGRLKVIIQAASFPD